MTTRSKNLIIFFSSNGFSYTALLLQVSVLFWSASRSGALIQSAVLRPFASLHLLRIIVIHDSSNIAGILKAVGSSGAWRRCCCKWRSFRRRKHSCCFIPLSVWGPACTGPDLFLLLLLSFMLLLCVHSPFISSQNKRIAGISCFEQADGQRPYSQALAYILT